MDASTSTKSHQIAAELRAMIAAGTLPRGAKIAQDSVAAQFETSITPVREALRLLEAEGLVTAQPNRGVRVAETNAEEQRGIYIARMRLEPFAAQLATDNLTRRDLAHAGALIDAGEAAGAAGDQATLREANRALHFFLYERAEVPRLLTLIEQLWAAFPWDILEVTDPRGEHSVQEHRTILEHMRSGDKDAVGAAFEAHLERSHHALLARLP